MLSQVNLNIFNRRETFLYLLIISFKTLKIRPFFNVNKRDLLTALIKKCLIIKRICGFLQNFRALCWIKSSYCSMFNVKFFGLQLVQGKVRRLRRRGQDGLGGRELRLGWANGPSAAAITCFKENIVHYLRLGQASEAPQATIGAERCGYYLF